MDVNCGRFLGNHTKSALLKGTVSESDIDRALNNLFSVRMRLGLFNGLPSRLIYGNLRRKDICSPEHQELALEAARHGIVLLKNSGNLLPLSKANTKSLAVIGPNANVSKTLLGNYAGPPCTTITPLQGLMSYVKDIKYDQGCDNINCTSIVETSVELAKEADYVVLVMGLNQTHEREDLDREDLVLPGKQQSLIMSVAEAAKNPVVLVLLCGGPVDVSFAKDVPKIGSILWAGYPGQAGGKAVAEIIFGDHNPGKFHKKEAHFLDHINQESNVSTAAFHVLCLGGRLSMTWYPQEFTKIPMTDMRMRPDPSSGYPGRTYKFYQGKTVFEFGYGLSYSNYSYKFVSVAQNKLDFKASSASNSSYVSVSDVGLEFCEKAKFSAEVSVENEGNMAGKHPVLLFFRRSRGGSSSPVKQLVGFETVKTNAKEKVSVEFQVNPCEHFSRASEDGVMVIESGDGLLVVGDEEYPITINI